MPSPSSPKPREIILEVSRIGSSLRVTAVDVATGTEAVFQAPVNAGEADVRRIAASKLNYIMRKGKK